MNDILISVIMAEYNTHIEYLKKAIGSILAQTFTAFEFIIVDDCGKNNLQSIIDEFDDERIVLIKNCENKGLVYSLNRGVQEARGQYIVRMDTDDIAYPNRIELLYQYIEQHPEYSVVGSRVHEFNGEEILGIYGHSGERTKKEIFKCHLPVHPSIIVKTEHIRCVGGYDNFFRCEDFALWCKFIVKGYRLFVIETPLLKYRVERQDYKKRGWKSRRSHLKACLVYFPQMNAHIYDYFVIIKIIIGGLLPTNFTIKFRSQFILK